MPSLADLRKQLERHCGSNDFYNHLMCLCAQVDKYRGTTLNMAYATLVTGIRGMGVVGWHPGALEVLLGNTNLSVEVFMHMMEKGFCTMWTTIYCEKCHKPYLCCPLDDMREYVLEGTCPHCRASTLVDKFHYFVFDLKYVPWEIDVPFHPYVRFDDGKSDRDSGSGLPDEAPK